MKESLFYQRLQAKASYQHPPRFALPFSAQAALTWIAALARQHRLTRLTFDAHFAKVPGLVLV